jgi:hypothetical protein
MDGVSVSTVEDLAAVLAPESGAAVGRPATGARNHAVCTHDLFSLRFEVVAGRINCSHRYRTARKGFCSGVPAKMRGTFRARRARFLIGHAFAMA